MLKRLYADNFRCLVNFEIPFGPIALLLGPNGSGKSTIFSVIRRLRDFILEPKTAADLFPPSTRCRWMHQAKQSFELTIRTPHGDCLYRLVLDGLGSRVRVAEECLLLDGERPLFTFKEGQLQLYRDDSSRGPGFPYNWELSGLGAVVPAKDNLILTTVKATLAHFVVASLNPPIMDTESETEEPSLRSDGRNFASWYRGLSQENQDRLPALFDVLKGPLPGFAGCQLVKQGADVRSLEVRFLLNGAGMQLKFGELSDGQRAQIVLHTLTLGIGGPYHLFLDEPENYLALPEIQPWLMQVKDAIADGHTDQAVLISHHPELIDYLGAEAGIPVWLKTGDSGAARLAEPPKLGEEVLRLSEEVARGWVP